MKNEYTNAVEMLNTLKGKARERTVGENDLQSAIRIARKKGWTWIAGHTVANNYQYPAHRMRLIVVCRSNGDLVVSADWGSANKGHSPIPSTWPRQFNLSHEKFYDQLKVVADLEPHSSWIILPGNIRLPKIN